MTLQQLRYFLAACQHGSFTSAAEALYVARPSVAGQVRRLERELGVRLFIRAAHGLELTEAGVQLREGTERVLAAVGAARTSVENTVKLRSGTASLGTFAIAHHYLVHEVVSAFAARYPGVTIRVVGQHSSEITAKVRNGELEAGLIALPVDESGLVVESVMSDEILYAAMPSSQTTVPMSMTRLTQSRLIVYTAALGWDDSVRRQLLAWARDEDLELRAAIEVEHLESAVKLACSGLGGTYVPQAVVPMLHASRPLCFVSFERRLYDSYAFIWRRDHSVGPATRELMAMAREHLQQQVAAHLG